MAKPIEKRLSRLLVAAFARVGLWHYKLEDPPRGHFASGGARYTRRRPFDYIVVRSGYAIEVKATRATSFALRPHQDAALAAFERTRAGQAVVAVFVQHPQASPRWTLWWLPYRAYAAYLRRMRRKSFPVSALPHLAIQCIRPGRGIVLPTVRTPEPHRDPSVVEATG